METDISVEEKLDYIYTTLQKQEKRHKIGIFIKWGFRLLILVYIYIFFIYMLPSIMWSLTSNMMPQMGWWEWNSMNTKELMEMAREYFNKK